MWTICSGIKRRGFFLNYISNFNGTAYKFLLSGWCSQRKSQQFNLIGFVNGKTTHLAGLFGCFLFQIVSILAHSFSFVQPYYIGLHLHKTLPNKRIAECYCINDVQRKKERDSECDSHIQREREKYAKNVLHSMSHNMDFRMKVSDNTITMQFTSKVDRSLCSQSSSNIIVVGSGVVKAHQLYEFAKIWCVCSSMPLIQCGCRCSIRQSVFSTETSSCIVLTKSAMHCTEYSLIQWTMLNCVIDLKSINM